MTGRLRPVDVILVVVILVIFLQGTVSKSKIELEDSCVLKWKKLYEHDALGTPLNGNISDVIQAVQVGKRLKVLLITEDAGIKSLDNIDHVIIQDGKIAMYITNYLYPGPGNSFKNFVGHRIWCNISSDGIVVLRVYNILEDVTVMKTFRTGIQWLIEESIGTVSAYHSVEPDLLGEFMGVLLRGSRISVVIEDDKKIYAFPMNHVFLDSFRGRFQALHKLRQIRFPIGSFRHERHWLKPKWFTSGCWSKLTRSSFLNEARSNQDNSVESWNDLRVIVKHSGHKPNYIIDPECINTNPDGNISVNLFHYYALGTWKKYPDHTKWECQTVSSTGMETKTKYLGLMNWIVSTKTRKHRSCDWFADESYWRLLMAVNKTGNITNGSRETLTNAAFSGASLRIAIFLFGKKSVFSLREIDIFPGENRVKASVVDCAYSNNPEELGLIEIDSIGKVQVSVWDISRRHARGVRDWINVRQEWYGRL